MRYALACGLTLCLSLFALTARAASVDFMLTLQPGSTEWVLEVTTEIAVSAIAVEASTSLGTFTRSPLLPISPCCEIFVPVQSGRNLLRLDPEGPALLVPAFQFNVLLGTFSGSTASAALVELVGAEDSAGFTVLDSNGDIVEDYSITIVPEPASALLALGAFAALRVVRRRP